LLIASTGTRSTRIFERHPGWDAAAPYIVLPDEADQQLIHERIYREVKTNDGIKSFVSFLEDQCLKYEVNSFVAGCTDIHRVTSICLIAATAQSLSLIDPLQIIAKNYEDFVDE